MLSINNYMSKKKDWISLGEAYKDVFSKVVVSEDVPAGEVGNADGSGHGGDGLSNAITGAATFYGGGGGGSPSPSSPSYPGGDGGGGDAVVGGANSNNATSNLGGGSGGGNDGTIGNGGSGVVILRVLTSEYPGTTTGSPTVTTDGSHKVIKFTGSGSYTA